MGKTYNTTIHKDLTDEEYLSVKEEYYTKPDFEDVKNQLIKVKEGGTKINYITNYYVKDLMAKVRVYFNNWTIEEALNYKPLVEFFAGKANDNKKVFPDTMSLGKKVETCFRLCGFKTASKPSNFPIKTVDEVLSQYNVNGNYYDYSCGWGSRLLGSLRNNINYFGTDPNYILCDRLRDMANTYKEVCNSDKQVDIRSQGSEVFIPEWEDTMGVAFSSPPYFNLEDYGIGNQSYHEGITYEQWLNKYMRNTVKNARLYLIDEGFFIININNYKGCKTLVEDVVQVIQSEGFYIYDVHTLKNIKRCHGHKEWNPGECGWNDNSEKIIVFKKISRTCTCCGNYMQSGYIIGEGDEYFCSDECLHSHYSEEEYEEECANDNAYWTEWDD